MYEVSTIVSQNQPDSFALPEAGSFAFAMILNLSEGEDIYWL